MKGTFLLSFHPHIENFIRVWRIHVDRPGDRKRHVRTRQDDVPETAFASGMLRAIPSVAVTPRGGAECDDPCHISWYFCRRTAALKNGRTHHPCLRKNRGRLLWCPWDGLSILLPAERQPHPQHISILDNQPLPFSAVCMYRSFRIQRRIKN